MNWQWLWILVDIFPFLRSLSLSLRWQLFGTVWSWTRFMVAWFRNCDPFATQVEEILFGFGARYGVKRLVWRDNNLVRGLRWAGLGTWFEECALENGGSSSFVVRFPCLTVSAMQFIYRSYMHESSSRPSLAKLFQFEVMHWLEGRRCCCNYCEFQRRLQHFHLCTMNLEDILLKLRRHYLHPSSGSPT